MSLLYTNIGAKQVDPTPKNMATNTELTPGTKIVPVVYTTVVGETTADTINLLYVPKGTRVFATRSKLRTSAAVAASAFAVHVGFLQDDAVTDVDRFGTAININGGAGEFALDEPVAYTFLTAGWITMTPSTVTGAVTAAVTIEAELAINYPN